MFNQKDEEGSPNIDTLIGAKTALDGDIRFSGGLHVDGKITGCLASEDGEHGLVVISEQGRVEGEIKVPEVIVNGQVEGDIVAASRVELRENARVSGNIRYGAIQMAFGAQVNGQLVCESKASKTVPGGPRPETKPEKNESGKGKDEKSAA